QRVDVTRTTPGIEIVSQLPGTCEEHPDGTKKFGVPIEERIGRVDQDAPERSLVIDRVLPALRAILAGQRRAAVLAICQDAFAFAFFSPSAQSAPPFFRRVDRGISENELRLL